MWDFKSDAGLVLNTDFNGFTGSEQKKNFYDLSRYDMRETWKSLQLPHSLLFIKISTSLSCHTYKANELWGPFHEQGASTI